MPTASRPAEDEHAAFRHSYSKDRAAAAAAPVAASRPGRGIGRMIERDDYCIDILQQTAALRAAVDAVSLLVMEDHVAGCLRRTRRDRDANAYTEEVMDVVRHSMGRPVRTARPASD